MSDYLSGIVSRALQLEPAVRPVVPSMFETASGGGFGEVQVETEAFTSVSAARPVMRPSAIAQTDEVAAEIAPQSREVRPAAPTEPALTREVRVETTRSEATVPAVERHVIEHITATEKLVRERHEFELRELVRETVAPPAAPITPAVRAAAETVARPVTAVPAVVTPAPRPARPGIVAPSAEPAPEPEASVRVTIGRVEVRAVFPQGAPAAAEKQRSAPVMPLEEYLKLGNRRAR